MEFATYRTKIYPFRYPKSFMNSLYREYARQILEKCEYKVKTDNEKGQPTHWTKARKNKLIKELKTMLTD